MTPPVAQAAPPRGLVDTIFRSWRDPRGVMAAQVAGGLSEARALVHLLLACGLFFVASLPAAVRTSAALDVDEPVSAAVSAHLFAWGAVAPLVAYALAVLVHLVARAFGGQPGFLRARAALFWSALAAAPAVLAAGLAGVVLPDRPWLGLAAAGVWVWLFSASLAEAEGFASTVRVSAGVVAAIGLALLAVRAGVR